jgi:hypothetical protein
MSNDNIPKFEDTEEIIPSFEDTEDFTDNIDLSQTGMLTDKGSVTDSFMKGAEQGVTLGFADELAGGIQSGLESLVKFGIPGILPEGISKTPQQVNQDLLSQGFTGDDLTRSTYESARDLARQDYKEAERSNPGSYIGGNITGGALTAIIPGGVGAKIMSPLGEAAQGASALTKATQIAKNALPVGAAIGLGTSEAEKPVELGLDVASGALLSGVVGGGLNLAGQGLTAGKDSLGNLITSKAPTIARAYEKGKEGVNTLSKQFGDSVNKRIGEFTETVSKPFIEKRKEIIKRNDLLSSKNDEIISEVGKQLTNVNDEISKLKTNLSQTKLDKIEKAKLGYGQQLTNKLLDVKNKIKTTYDTIESQLDDAGVNFNMNTEISEFGEDLINNGLMPDQAQSFSNRLVPFFEKADLTIPELKQMKMITNKMMESPNPAIKMAARKLYSKINQNQINTISENGFSDVAKKLTDTNKKYVTALDLEDELVGSLQKDRVLQKTVVDDTIIKNLGKFVKQDASSVNTANILREKAKQLDPKFSNLVENVYGDLNQKADIADLLKSKDLFKNNAEIKRLQDLTNQLNLKKVKPEITSQDQRLLLKDEDMIKNEVRDILGKIDNPLDETSKVKATDILNEYQNLSGKKANITDEALELSKDMDLVRSSNEEVRGMISPKSVGALQTFGQYPANLAGRAIGKVSNVANKYLSQPMSKISGIANKDVGTIVNNLRGFKTPEASMYVEQLTTAASKGPDALNAALFSAKQQPAFRRLLNKDDENKDK